MSFTERELAYTEELMERFANEIVYKCPRCGLEQMLLKEGARIRELEEADRVHWKVRRSLLKDIAKAKAILEAALRSTRYENDIHDALEALEGK